MRFCLLLRLGLVFALALTAGSEAARAEPSFEGKRVVMIVSSAPGGGTDSSARLIGRFLARHLPGQPALIYQNMPGAGGINALNNFFLRADPDGLTLFSGAGNELNPTNLQRSEVKYDPRRLAMIGGFANDSSFLLLRKEARGRLVDRRAAPVVMAEIDGTRSSAQMALWGADVLGWNVKWVLGYVGTSDMLLALERGEADMAANNVLSGIARVLDSGKATVLAQTGMLAEGRPIRSALYPDTPLVSELVAGRLSGRAEQAFGNWQREAQLGKWYALPPGTPADIVDAYRAAFLAAFADPEFRDLAPKQLRPDYRAMSVADLSMLVEALVATAPETLDYMLALRKRYGL